ncbi:MAG: PaaI family thioesterase, partial [Candidatus Binataceae bacterium]
MGELTRAEAVAQEAYARWLGVQLKSASGTARIELPYKEENSNPGKQVHGGVVASALAMAGRIAALAGTEIAEPCAIGTLYLSVAYLASAVSEAILAEGRVLRRGKELCHVRSDAANPGGKPLGTATLVFRAAPGVDPAPIVAPIDRSGDA